MDKRATQFRDILTERLNIFADRFEACRMAENEEPFRALGMWVGLAKHGFTRTVNDLYSQSTRISVRFVTEDGEMTEDYPIDPRPLPTPVNLSKKELEEAIRCVFAAWDDIIVKIAKARLQVKGKAARQFIAEAQQQRIVTVPRENDLQGEFWSAEVFESEPQGKDGGFQMSHDHFLWALAFCYFLNQQMVKEAEWTPTMRKAFSGIAWTGALSLYFFEGRVPAGIGSSPAEGSKLE